MMVTLPVNEIFVSIQGEATFTGTPATFIRLQGCPVGCGWCDTKHTWVEEQSNATSIPIMLEKTEDAPTFARMSAYEIEDAMLNLNSPKHVVITGGEPAIHDLRPLTERLDRHGYRVQIETSGHYLPRVSPKTFITCSPKMNMPGGSASPEYVRLADEIKWPVGKQKDIDNLRNMLSFLPSSDDRAVWLQPLSTSKKATELCVRAAIDNGWRVSIQTHKYMNVR